MPNQYESVNARRNRTIRSRSRNDAFTAGADAGILYLRRMRWSAVDTKKAQGGLNLWSGYGHKAVTGLELCANSTTPPLSNVDEHRNE